MLESPSTAVLAWRRYCAPGLVLGAGQRATPELQARAAARGVAVATRDSGGGAILSGPWMLGLSLQLAPESLAARAGPRETFRRFGAACREALEEMGVAAALATDADIARSAAQACVRDLRWACFGTLSYGEIVDPAGRKMLGLAQCRRRGGVLLDGGLLLNEPDWALLCELFGKPAEAGAALRDATTALAGQHSPGFEPEAFCGALRCAVARHFSEEGHPR